MLYMKVDVVPHIHQIFLRNQRQARLILNFVEERKQIHHDGHSRFRWARTVTHTVHALSRDRLGNTRYVTASDRTIVGYPLLWNYKAEHHNVNHVLFWMFTHSIVGISSFITFRTVGGGNSKFYKCNCFLNSFLSLSAL